MKRAKSDGLERGKNIHFPVENGQNMPEEEPGDEETGKFNLPSTYYVKAPVQDLVVPGEILIVFGAELSL